jgi:methyltransferase (TIGR00027 family)
MRKGQASVTALGIALVRALETERPAGQRIFSDPFARHFASGPLLRILRLQDRLGLIERLAPGVMGFLTARERQGDQVLQDFLEEGLEQLVLLGAGYDARPYRFEAALKDVRVFEVDHPATQRRKRERLAALLERPLAQVTFVPVDFSTQSLADRLASSGYDPRAKTLFIWQGVTPYLRPEAVDATLAFVAHSSGPGSGIVFDYVDPTYIAGPRMRREFKRMRLMRLISGEQIIFGLQPEQVVGFLEQRGFADVDNATHDLLHARYFHGEAAARIVGDGYGVVTARVR